MEFLMNNINWFEDQIGDYSDDYLIIDCPGQIELFIHLPIMKELCYRLESWGYKMCGVYLLDSIFITDATRFLSGVLTCISAMVRLELPHINLLSKCDLLGSSESGWEEKLSHYLCPEPKMILNDVTSAWQLKKKKQGGFIVIVAQEVVGIEKIQKAELIGAWHCWFFYTKISKKHF